jgi:heptosyltransferase-2
MRKGSIANSTIFRSRCRNLLVLAPNWLGDAVMATPLLLTARNIFPDAYISVACDSYVSGIFHGNPSLDSLIYYTKRKGIRAVRSVLKSNRPADGWDICFVLPPSFSSALTAFLSGAAKRVGYGGQWRSFLLTDVLPRLEYRSAHLSSVYIELIAKITGERINKIPLPVVMGPDKWKDTLKQKGLNESYVVLAAGATYGTAKAWPAERYRALAIEIAGRTGLQIVAVGTESERSIASIILGSLNPGGTNLAGECTLDELLAVLRGARLVVGNDSGPVHLSAALGRPTVAIFGSTSPAWTAPRGKAVRIVSMDLECSPCFRRECPRGEAKCLLGIGVQEVCEASLDMLGKGLGSKADLQD